MTPPRKRGKPPLSDTEPTIHVTVKMTPSQREMLRILGGSGWIRSLVEREWRQLAKEKAPN